MYWAYVIRSERNAIRYIGQTSNLEKRLSDHNSGMSRYTKGREPWKLEYSEEHPTRSSAMLREGYFKTGKGREFLDSLTK